MSASPGVAAITPAAGAADRHDAPSAGARPVNGEARPGAGAGQEGRPSGLSMKRDRQESSGSDEALEFAAERHRFVVDRQKWERDRRAMLDELEQLRREHATAPASDAQRPGPAAPALRQQLDAAHAQVAQLRAELEAQNERISVLERDRAAAERTRQELETRLRAAQATPVRVMLPVLCRDLARWSTPAGPRPLAVPIGPPPLPPALDDIATAEQQVAMLRRLLRLVPEQGKSYHTLFDLHRFQAIQSKLKEAGLLADRLINQFERSKNQKDLLWHLMLAQRNQEINRRRR